MNDLFDFGTRVRFTEDFYEWFDWDDTPTKVADAGRECVVEGRSYIGGNSWENVTSYLVVYRTDGFEESWWVPGRILERV